MGIFSNLKRDQKEAIGLLQIGTFLEYFDLMLYVHMAVILNELFFPKTDPHTAALLSAFAFCSTYVLRPFGALIFGYIGDNIGRKATVIITTMLMSLSCIVMANMPTYAQIGIAASWAVTICRAIQGLTSMGEIVAAEIYLTETVRPPAQYPAVGLMSCSSALGTMMALGAAMIVFSLNMEWRLAFWFGATIAVIGSIARTRLRETPEFLQSKKLMHKNSSARILQNKNFNVEKKRTSVTFFLIYCAWPVCFYFVYVHCGNILKFSFNYSAQEIIQQNFYVSLVQTVGYLLFAFLSYYVHPLRILKYKLYAIFPVLLICPYLLSVISNGTQLFCIQSILIFFAMTAAPAMPIFIKRFPVFKRFTYTSFIYALTRASMYVLTSFGLVYLTELLGHWGLWLVLIPCALGFWWGVKHFEDLESLPKDEFRSFLPSKG
jgi:MFS transporter, MHS family, proline/betaine transporter